MTAWPAPTAGALNPQRPDWCDGTAPGPDPVLVTQFGNWMTPMDAWPSSAGPLTVTHDGTTDAPMYRWFELSNPDGGIAAFTLRCRFTIVDPTSAILFTLHVTDTDLYDIDGFNAAVTVVEAPLGAAVDINANGAIVDIDAGVAAPAGTYDLVTTLTFDTPQPTVLVAAGSDVDEASEPGATITYMWWAFNCYDAPVVSDDCGVWITVNDLPSGLVFHDITPLAIQTAVEWLNAATDHRWNGVCHTTIRPPVGHNNACTPTSTPARYIDLSLWITGPIRAIVDVTVNGVTITDDHYRLVGNQLWPTRPVAADPALIPWPTQNFEYANGNPDTWSVTVEHGEPVPAPLRLVAVDLARELILRAIDNDNCALPDRVTSITRDGITYSFQMPEGAKIGVPFIDSVVAAFGPTGAGRTAPRMLDPAADYRAETWPL